MESVHPLKEYRERHGLTQDQLAAKLGKKGRSKSAIVSRWETGKRQPERHEVEKISALTGIPPAELRPDLAELFATPTGRRPARGRAGASAKSRAA